VVPWLGHREEAAKAHGVSGAIMSLAGMVVSVGDMIGDAIVPEKETR